jgi:hypothetical protein
MLHVVRTGFDTARNSSFRIFTEIRGHQSMDLGELCTRQQDKGNAWFELIGEVRHEGVSATESNRGHYFTYVKDATGRWMKFDDSRVSFMAPWDDKVSLK